MESRESYTFIREISLEVYKGYFAGIWERKAIIMIVVLKGLVFGTSGCLTATCTYFAFMERLL